MAERDKAVVLGLLALGAVWLFSRKADASPYPGLIATPTGPQPDPAAPPRAPATPDEPRPTAPDIGGLADVPLPPVEPAPPAPLPEPLPEPVPEVGAWIADTPTPGRFYQVKKTDQAAHVAAQALGGVGSTPGYIQSWALVPWNLELYATPWAGEDLGWPKFYTSQIDGSRFSMRKAFQPRHQNAGIRLVNGQPVERNITWTSTGSKLSGAFASYGLLWLPSEENPTPPAFIMEIAGL